MVADHEGKGGPAVWLLFVRGLVSFANFIGRPTAERSYFVHSRLHHYESLSYLAILFVQNRVKFNDIMCEAIS